MSRSKTIGAFYRFTYPNYGTPDGYPDYTAHSGQRVKCLRRLKIPEEASVPMYEVVASDGWKGHCHGDELRKLKR